MQIPTSYQKKTCAICRDSATEELFKVSGEYLENETGDSLTLDLNYVVCRDCGLVFTDPQLVDASWLAFYRGCRNGSNQGESEENLLARYNSGPIRLSRQYVEAGQSVLDIGCGGGEFLFYLRHHCQCRPYGLEVSEILAAQARQRFGLKVFIGVLNHVELPLRKYDVISLIHVLEHMQDPQRALLELKDFLTEDGVLILAVPSVFKPLGGIRNIYSSHNTLFSPVTLARLCTLAGFEIVDQDTSADIVFILRQAKVATPQAAGSDYEKVKSFVPRYVKENLARVELVEKRLHGYLRHWRQQQSQVYIWGGGEHTRKLFRQFDFSGVNLLGIIDSDPGCWGQKCCGLQVVAPESGCRQAVEILVSSNAFEQEISATIRKLNPAIEIRTLYH